MIQITPTSPRSYCTYNNKIKMSDVSEICFSALINNWIHAHCEFKYIPLWLFFQLPSKTVILYPGFPWKPLIRFQNTSKQYNPSLEMVPWSPRKPVSYFDSGVDGMEILMPGTKRVSENSWEEGQLQAWGSSDVSISPPTGFSPPPSC